LVRDKKFKSKIEKWVDQANADGTVVKNIKTIMMHLNIYLLTLTLVPYPYASTKNFKISPIIARAYSVGLKL